MISILSDIMGMLIGQSSLATNSQTEFLVVSILEVGGSKAVGWAVVAVIIIILIMAILYC